MRMVFGRYMPFNSVIHKMDPRLKMLSTILLIIAIFFSIGMTGLLAITIFVAIIYLISRLPLRMLLRLLFPIIFIFLVLIIIYVFLEKAPPGANSGLDPTLGYYYRWSVFTFSEMIVYKSIYITLRILLMITLTTILTGTTQPLEISLAVEDLLFPLKLVKFPVHILSTVISIALRMIPTLIDEAGRIIKAQSSRGIDIKNGKFKDKLKGTVSLIIPLLVSAFNKADDLAYAMESRGYDPHSKRTRFRQFKFSYVSFFIFLIFLGIGVFAIVYSFEWPITQSFLHIPHVDLILSKTSM